MRHAKIDAVPSPDPLDIFLTAPPGLEPVLAQEAAARGFGPARIAPGGVAVSGGWPELWRANLQLRGAERTLVRLGAFRAAHLAQLDKRARRLPWDAVLPIGAPARVEASCARSRIYHDGAAAQRVEGALRAALGPPRADAPPIRVLCRIVEDLCQISLDASGEPLHKRGFKLETAKAPIRETMAALLLRACGYAGTEPLVDPMCGSGTFAIEAAEIAAGLAPGRSRAFAFERFVGFDADAFAAMRAAAAPDAQAAAEAPFLMGADRDEGAIRASQENARRAGVDALICFRTAAVGALARPEGPPGLVIVNPPYGRRIGDAKALRALYAALGRVLRERFGGWRVGLVTSETALARATGLPFEPPGPALPHGGVRVRLHLTAALA